MGAGSSQENWDRFQSVAEKLPGLCEEFVRQHQLALDRFQEAQVDVPETFAALPNVIRDMRIFDEKERIIGEFKGGQSLRELQQRKHKVICGAIVGILASLGIRNKTSLDVVIAVHKTRHSGASGAWISELGVKIATPQIQSLLESLKTLLLIETAVYSHYDAVVDGFIRLVIIDPILRAKKKTIPSKISTKSSKRLAADLQLWVAVATVVIEAVADDEDAATREAKAQTLEAVSAVTEVASSLVSQVVGKFREDRKTAALTKYHEANSRLTSLISVPIAGKRYRFDLLRTGPLSRAEVVAHQVARCHEWATRQQAIADETSAGIAPHVGATQALNLADTEPTLTTANSDEFLLIPASFRGAEIWEREGPASGNSDDGCSLLVPSSYLGGSYVESDVISDVPKDDGEDLQENISGERGEEENRMSREGCVLPRESSDGHNHAVEADSESDGTGASYDASEEEDQAEESFSACRPRTNQSPTKARDCDDSRGVRTLPDNKPAAVDAPEPGCCGWCC